MEWLQIVGLCLDIAGATIIGWPVMFMSGDEAAQIGLAVIAADTKEANLKLPPVVALLRQRTGARVGFGLILVGFAVQAVSLIL